MIIPIGSIVNALAVLIGSIIGIKFGELLPEKVKRISFECIGLFTIVLGVKMAQSSQNLLTLLICLILGGLIGEYIDIDRFIEKKSEQLKIKIKSTNKNFSKGLITAFVLYCIGSMTIVGAIEEGIHQDRTLLYTKSLMDGITSILLASNFGYGVLFSAFPLLLFQSIITLSAVFLEPYLPAALITEITAVGGCLILAIGLNILELVKIKVSNILPALFITVPIYYITQFIKFL